MRTSLCCLATLILGLALGIFFGRRPSAQAKGEVVSETDRDPPLLTDIESEVANPLSPVKFDPQVNEYELRYGYETNGERHIFHCPLRYDPWTGKKLPPSTRPDAILRAGSSGTQMQYIPPYSGSR